jgi:hypothetical protein
MPAPAQITPRQAVTGDDMAQTQDEKQAPGSKLR